MEDATADSRLFLIGSAASQAMSPGLWNPLLEQLGSSWTYEAWDVPAEQAMTRVRGRLLDRDVVAANVTMPHKQWAAGTADSSTDAVQLSGACNLLVRQGRRLHGHNTDITAAAVLLGNRYQRHALLLGAGGAARAALIALDRNVGKVSITDRDPNASGDLLHLALDLGIDAQAVTWQQAQDLASEASLIVNATPIGKGISDGPAWGDGPVAADALVYDFVYAGHVTASIAKAREAGATCVDGWDHLREQAVAMVPLLGLDGAADSLLAESLDGLKSRH
ncbi:shikimate dehydrogenase family protein [Pseudarthrobacter sulfonivorans]|uniref:shikimate dehydrogenase family protein n=1 Tax=Pseudarthrobacter sulfonivorans TaxID=121292 RepID=UPI0021071418|nr:shikimate dehydrogenase [Pseudarthrobacter sulfonivorans]